MADALSNGCAILSFVLAIFYSAELVWREGFEKLGGEVLADAARS